MAQNPFLKVFIQSGYYDGATNNFQATYPNWQRDPSGKMKDRLYFTTRVYLPHCIFCLKIISGAIIVS
jgi:carboxypeptidase C (cathepsin A)